MLQNCELDPHYRTDNKDPIASFYLPCLRESVVYKRAVGYFRSSVFTLIAEDFLNFALKGGKYLLICSPELDEKDFNTFASNIYEQNELISKSLVSEINLLLQNESTQDNLKVLSTLLKFGVMDIKIAVRPSNQGLYHEKLGIFVDEFNNKVSFVGSANESWSGWHSSGNFESIEVFSSWRNFYDKERCDRHEQNFDRLWQGHTNGIRSLSFPEAARELLITKSFNSLEEAREVIQRTQNIISLPKNNGAKKNRPILPHQSHAIAAWLSNNSSGIFEHATGSGKTFTGLMAAKSHIEKGLPVLILVPSKILFKQWEEDILDLYPEASIMLVGDGNNKWKVDQKLRSFSSNTNAEIPRFILAIMQTACSEEFIKKISQGKHLMLLIDEVHQIGSEKLSNCLNIISGPKLGLSATPERYGDPLGTNKILSYFGGVIEPKFTLQDAVKAGRLVQYEYHPHFVFLNEDELDEWKNKTKEIGILIARLKAKEDVIQISDKLKWLLIERARIAKKANSKLSLAKTVLKENFANGQRWLIYCDDSKQLQQVKSIINELGIPVADYHSAMAGDKEATLEWFKAFSGVLVSIECLDEGVDIPTVTHALILASSQNPRQFIQRRGRVLRVADNKTLAYVHDAIVLPVDVVRDVEQKSLLKTEMKRALEFANFAINSSASSKIRAKLIAFNIDPDSLTEEECVEDE